MSLHVVLGGPRLPVLLETGSDPGLFGREKMEEEKGK